MDSTVLDGQTDGRNLADLLDFARDAVRGGRLMEAKATCETILESHPDQPDGWHLLGMTALRNGDPETARSCLQRAVEMRRGYAPYRVSLGQALRRTGDAEGAHRQFHDACILDPKSHDAAFGLAATSAATGHRTAATVLHRLALRLLRRNTFEYLRRRCLEKVADTAALFSTVPGQGRPHGFTSAMILARWLAARGDNRAAFAALERAHRECPDDPRPLIKLGRQSFEAENFVLAHAFLTRANEIAPKNIEAMCEYGRTLSRMARHEQALAILEDAHLSDPNAIRPLLLLGWARYRAGQSQRAISDFDAVLEQQPTSAEAHYGRARALVDAGNAGEAKRWFHRTVALSPGHAGALRELAGLKDLSPGDAEFQSLINGLDDETAPARRRSVLHMAAGAACHGVKAYGDAFEHYRNGNLLKDVTFDIHGYAGFIDCLIDGFGPAHFEHTEDWGHSSDTPVFILGMPRSGTSLVEQILASHSRTHGAGEREEMLQLADRLPELINDSRAYPECLDGLTRDTADKLATDYLAVLKRCDPHAARITDKMPGNFHHVGLIATLFPNAPIIHCQRDPRDICLSIFFGDFVGSHPYSYDLTNLGRYYRQYERLMDHWHKVLPGRILDVRYEELVEDQETLSRRMISHCGLDWEARCLDFHKTDRNVRTRSNLQVRQPIYRSSVERWRTYEAHLEPLFAALEAEPVSAETGR